MSTESRKAIITISWKFGRLDINVEGNLSYDTINLALDMVKETIVKQMVKQQEPVGFRPRVLP